MTETGRWCRPSALEAGRDGCAWSGSVELSPILERMAVAIDLRTLWADSCLVKSDLALAGAFLYD